MRQVPLLNRRQMMLQSAALASASMVMPQPVLARARKPVQTGEIDAALLAKVNAKEVPGIVAMAANEQSVVYERAFGLRNMAAATPMSTDTVFRIASMVKLLTSVAALQLVERG